MRTAVVIAVSGSKGARGLGAEPLEKPLGIFTGQIGVPFLPFLLFCMSRVWEKKNVRIGVCVGVY